MPKDLKITFLLDFYGDMLTQTQRDMIESYYNEDLSLGEIALHREISRQGVRDSIKRAEQQLLEMEERLGLARKFKQVQDSLRAICDYVLEIQRLNSGNLQIDEIDDNVEKILELVQDIATDE